MTKAAALQGFFASFGLPAYEESSVPPDADFPRITYQAATDDFGHPVAVSASIWYKSTSWVQANAKVEEISQRIGRQGAFADYNTGTIWIQRGHPWAQRMGDPETQNIKRVVLNLTAEFWSAD